MAGLGIGAQGAFDTSQWTAELKAAKEGGNAALGAFVAKLAGVEGPIDVKALLSAQAFLAMQEGPGALPPLDPEWKDKTGARLGAALEAATESSKMIPEAKTAQAVLDGWPLRSLRADVVVLSEKARKSGAPMTLHSFGDNHARHSLAIGKDGTLIYTMAEKDDFGHTYSGPANAKSLEHMGVYSGSALDAMIAHAAQIAQR